MIRHNLYEVDREKKTAFCTACGYTELYMVKSRKEGVPKVYCLNRQREKREAEKRRQAEDQRLKPGWKPRHSLSYIDAKTMTAFCAVCGPTDIQKHTDRGRTHYECGTKVRQYTRKYRRLHYTPRRLSLSVHTLSEIDEEKKRAVCSICGPVEIYVWQNKRKMSRRCSNASVYGILPAQQIRREINTRLLHEYKLKQGCKRCGYSKNPDRLFLHARKPRKNHPKVEKLLKLNHERLFQELEKTEVLCVICRSLVQKGVEIDRHGSELPVQIFHL